MTVQIEDFLPGLLVPVSSYPSVIAAFSLLFASIYIISLRDLAYTPLSISLAPLAIYFFWDFGYNDRHVTPANQVSLGLAVISLYGIMRVIETTFIGLLDNEPPYWISLDEKTVLQVQHTTLGRIMYSLDLTTSLRGTSIFEDRYWNWAPRSLAHSETSKMTRSLFIRKNLASVAYQYILIDVLDTLNKSRTWDTTNRYPVRSLPALQQFPFAVSVCAGTALSITFPHTLVSTLAVALGSSPSSWPPMFNHPFSATSLADFWTRRWHSIFRRVFDRLSSGLLKILHLLPGRKPPTVTVYKAIRAVVVFALSATLHIMLIYRIDKSPAGPPSPDSRPNPFVDPSILAFFLSQPVGLAIEALIIIPLAHRFLPEESRVAATRIWAWVFLLWTGRYWSDVWVSRGLWDEREKVVGFSVIRGLIWGTWIPARSAAS